MRQILLQNAIAILLQNVTEVYYKMHHAFITKCDSYYKMRRLLQIATVHSLVSFLHVLKQLSFIFSYEYKLALRKFARYIYKREIINTE